MIDWSVAQEQHRAPVTTSLDGTLLYVVLCRKCRGDYYPHEFNFVTNLCEFCDTEQNGEGT